MVSISLNTNFLWGTETCARTDTQTHTQAYIIYHMAKSMWTPEYYTHLILKPWTLTYCINNLLTFGKVFHKILEPECRIFSHSATKAFLDSQTENSWGCTGGGVLFHEQWGNEMPSRKSSLSNRTMRWKVFQMPKHCMSVYTACP